LRGRTKQATYEVTLFMTWLVQRILHVREQVPNPRAGSFVQMQPSTAGTRLPDFVRWRYADIPNLEAFVPSNSQPAASAAATAQQQCNEAQHVQQSLNNSAIASRPATRGYSFLYTCCLSVHNHTTLTLYAGKSLPSGPVHVRVPNHSVVPSDRTTVICAQGSKEADEEAQHEGQVVHGDDNVKQLWHGRRRHPVPEPTCNLQLVN
jgi:hypothetical protein